MKFQIVVSSYNSMRWLPKTVKSILDQDYKNYKVCIVDDGSTDKKQSEYVRKTCTEHGWNFIIHDTNMGALYSQVEAIKVLSPEDEDVIVWVDGDDWLANPNVLTFLNNHYKSTECLMTYGNYATEPASKTCPVPKRYDRAVEYHNSYRAAAYTHGLLFNHLRTVKYLVFKNLKESDFTWPDGTWFRCAGDTAVMIPCLELVNGKYSFIEEVLYIYNTGNPVSDWRKRSKEIDRTHKYILCDLAKKEPIQND